MRGSARAARDGRKTAVHSGHSPGIFASLGLRSIRLNIMLTGAAVGVVLFGTYGYYMLERERADLRSAVTREMRILGESLAVSIENALRDGQLEDVREIVNQVGAEDATVGLSVCDQNGKVVARSAGAVADTGTGDVVPAVLGGAESILRYESDLDPLRAVLALPLHADDGSVAGVLTILRPLEDVRRDLQRTREGIVLAVVLFVIAIASIGWFTGTWFVRRPLNDIRGLVASVRAGLFEEHIRVRRNDEIGALAGEFNQMIDALAEARRHRDEEIQARARLEHGMAEVAKLATTGQLAAALAHEIGSPLQVMAGRARSLAEHPDDPNATRRNAQILGEQCERIARIVEQLLTIVRRSPRLFSRFDFGPAARSVIELLAMQAEQARVSLRFHGPGRPLPITGNVDRLQQVVLNLVTNALAATPPGGTVDVTLAAADGGARLTVKDNGRGIEPEALSHVFDPFFTTRADSGGTGLGLTIVRSIVQEHGGRVNIESSPGVGASVTVELPPGPPVPPEVPS